MTKAGGIAGDHLKSFIERIERLEEEKKAIAEDIKDVYSEAKATGFDTKTMRAIIKLRALSQDERDEQEALLDLYKAALGMLSDTPLGEAAIHRASKKPPMPEAPSDDPAAPAPAEETGAENPEQEPAPEDTIEEAREKGSSAAISGQPVTANPYPARDKRRAAWDEAWCASSGSDGMEIPDFFRRTPKKKPAEGAASEPKAA